MAYADVGGLAGDPGYLSRLTACCTEQAATFINDSRPEFHDLAQAVITDALAAMWFAWVVAAQPGFGDAFASGGSTAITDPMLLSAVQATWPIVGAAHPQDAAA
jgi:hypothetical protein